MNFDINDILNMMVDGKDAETIAKEFTDALNSAIQKKKRDEELAAQAKYDALEDLVRRAYAFGEKYYPQIFAGADASKVDIAGLLRACDEAEKEVLAIKPTLNEIRDVLSKVDKKKDNSDPLAKFLRDNDLI